MIKYLFSISVTLLVICGLSAISYAGNQNNASNAGVVVAIVTCDAEGSPDIEQSQLSIKADGCYCTDNNVDTGGIDCEEYYDDCTECLSSLQRAGLTITFGNAYFDNDYDDEEIQYLLTGNAGPFLTREGCICD